LTEFFFWRRRYATRLGIKAFLLAAKLRKLNGMPEMKGTRSHWFAPRNLWKQYCEQREILRHRNQSGLVLQNANSRKKLTEIMNNLVPVGSPASPGTLLPVAIDYPAALALRQMALVQDELPKYLLAPEVSALLHYVPDLHRKMLLATLWNTGARINEALALTRGDFSLVPPYPFVQLATLKQRTEKAARTAGRAPAGSQVHRLVPLSDHHYVSQLQMMVATLKIPLERRNKRTGRMEKARIWEITDRTVRTWLSEAVEAAAADGVTFSVPVTPHTFRHSYAMHMLYAGIPLKVLQSLMGHKSISSTEVYTKVFALDVAARHRVQFAMPEAEAVALIKKLTPNQST